MAFLPFQRKRSISYGLQSLCFALVRFTTYGVLLCAAVIFIDIFYKGAKSLLLPTFPYVQWSFFTEFPETLHVFQDPVTQQTREMGEKAFRIYQESLGAKGALIESATYAYAAGGILPCIVRCRYFYRYFL